MTVNISQCLHKGNYALLKYSTNTVFGRRGLGDNGSGKFDRCRHVASAVGSDFSPQSICIETIAAAAAVTESNILFGEYVSNMSIYEVSPLSFLKVEVNAFSYVVWETSVL